ncbi:MAG: hypothetical protein GY714_20720 [Desulfobacterales bacterium]|nr:hypothetical protein [Desulfobacterales bacterium]
MIKIFNSNPKRATIDITDEEIIKIFMESDKEFHNLTLYHRGESKEIRNTSIKGILIQKLIPSLNSYTQKRTGMLENTEVIRKNISCIFWEKLHEEGIPTCYLASNDQYILVMEENIPPIEVIVKAAMVGTPAKIYHDLFSHTDRFGKPFVNNELHKPYVRFDYRNPASNENGDFLRDECLPLALAERFIDTKKSEENALKIFEIIQNTLRQIGLQVLDGCFFFDETGKTFCYEISPDNMRIKSLKWDNTTELDDYDKDLWRKRADDKLLKEQWILLQRKLEI